ncbi:MAG: MFS transporter [Lachnospiraceae bacterium]|nr:MFS transporter [Lachnospiraceae bacterium]
MKFSKGFWVCACVDILERFSYMIGYSLILIFATTSISNGGLGISEAKGAMIHSFLTGFVYVTPLLGGILVDRFIGARYTTPIGMLVVGIGYWCGSCARTETLIYLMIFLVSIGLGLFKNGTIVGKLITDRSKIDSAFSLRYTLVNIGALLGSLLAGVFYKDTFAHNGILGFSSCFKLAAIIMFLGTIIFVWGYRFMDGIGKRPFKEDAFSNESFNKSPLHNQKHPLSHIEKNRILAILLASGFSIIFWICWYLSYLPVYYYWSHKLNWTIHGYDIPITWFDSFDSLLGIILGPLVAILWNKLAHRPKGDLSLFQKTSIGLLILGVGYIYLYVINIMCKAENTFSVICLIPLAFVLALGEMVFSPLGHAFIIKYAPNQYLSTTMSLWGISNFIASMLYGPIYTLLFQNSSNFGRSCIELCIITITSAVILLKTNRYLLKLVESSSSSL